MGTKRTKSNKSTWLKTRSSQIFEEGEKKKSRYEMKHGNRNNNRETWFNKFFDDIGTNIKRKVDRRGNYTNAYLKEQADGTFGTNSSNPIGEMDKQMYGSNPLHNFASYNCLFTLSGVADDSLRNGRFLTDPLMSVIARSGGIGDRGSHVYKGEDEKMTLNEMKKRAIERDSNPDYKDSINILERGHDIFFENVNILSTVSPNPQRNLANFTKMEFELHEPYGVTLIEKIRAAAYQHGFKDYQAAPFLLTIEWKGFDEQGQQAGANDGFVRKIPILISRVEFDIDEGGAKYNLIAVPYGDLGFDDSYKFTRSEININADNLWDWVHGEDGILAGLKEQMRVEREEDKSREKDDQYEFLIDPEILKIVEKSTQAKGNKQHIGSGKKPPTEGFKTKSIKTQLDPGTSIEKAFEDVIRSMPYFDKLVEEFWFTYLTRAGLVLSRSAEQRQNEIKDFLTNDKRQAERTEIFKKNQFIDWFIIKPSVYNIGADSVKSASKTDNNLDKITKMYPKIIRYEAKLFKVPVLKLVLPGLSVGKIDWSNYVRRNYDYIYTGDNVDIQGLRINYKTAYYHRNVKDEPDTSTIGGQITNVIDNIKKSVGLEQDYPDPILPLRSYPSVIKRRNTADTEGDSARSQEFYDYLTNPEADMVRIELDILGDPAYVAQDMYTPIPREQGNTVDQTIYGSNLRIRGGGPDQDYNTTFHCFNVENYMPIVNIRYRIPTDLNDQKGVYFNADEGQKYLDDNLFFDGAYQVSKVQSTMNQGQFLQTLTLVRLNNQSTFGFGDLESAASGELSSVIEDKKKDIEYDIKKQFVEPFGKYQRY
jgi:hypothetical protein